MDTEAEKRRIAEGQKLDRCYYAVARSGYDPTTGEDDAVALQRYAARRSKQTRQRLLDLIGFH